MVTIEFGGEVFKTRILRRTVKSLRAGDFIEFGGKLVRIEAIQQSCPYIENLNRVFVMVTGKTATGELIPMRSLTHTVQIWRKVR